MFLTYGCTNSDEVANELIEYHNNDWLTFKNMHDEKLGPIASKFIILTLRDDQKGVEVLINEEFLPPVSELVDYLEGIKLENKEVQALNQLMIEIEKEAYNKFKQTAEVLERGDKKEIEERFDKHDAYKDEQEENFDKFYKEREKLMKKYDVHWIEEYDEDGERIDKMKRKEDD